MEVNYVKRNKINDQKWNDCLKNSTKLLIYGLSWYLDAATNRNWDAIIIGDYDAVLPLPWNRRFFIKRVVNPPLLQQLGPYGNTDSFNMEFEKVVAVLRKELKTYHLPLFIPSKDKRLNLFLDLSPSFDQIYEGFRKDRKYDARKLSLTCEDLTEDHERFLKFFSISSKDILEKTNADVQQISRIVQTCINKKRAKIWSVVDGNELVSAIFFTVFKNRLTLLLSTTNQKGYDIRANIILLLQLMRTYQNSNYILDFEGSEIPGVRDFYQSFGAKPEYYYIHSYQHRLIEKTRNLLSPSP